MSLVVAGMSSNPISSHFLGSSSLRLHLYCIYFLEQNYNMSHIAWQDIELSFVSIQRRSFAFQRFRFLTLFSLLFALVIYPYLLDCLSLYCVRKEIVQCWVTLRWFGSELVLTGSVWWSRVNVCIWFYSIWQQWNLTFVFLALVCVSFLLVLGLFLFRFFHLLA